MKKLSIIVFLLVSCFAQSTMAQEQQELVVKPSYQVSVSIGYLGLLALDEWNNGERLERKALAPISFSIRRSGHEYFSIGYYLGFEYEFESGGISEATSPNFSIVTGPTADLHFFRPHKRNLIDPFIGLSFYYVSIPGVEKGFVIGPRAGTEVNFNSKWSLMMNFGFSAAIFETGLTYSF